MSAFQAPAARSVLPLYLLSLGGLTACVGTLIGLSVADLRPATYLNIAIGVAVLSLVANAASIIALFKTCSAAAGAMRRSAGSEGSELSGHGVKRLVEAVRQVDAAFSERQREIERLNHADPLTGLGSRRWLQILASREFSQAEASGSRLSALMVRVDRLQEINEKYGHDAGDRALLGCADLLKRLVRRSDSVARVSGNEFVVLLPRTGAEAAEVVGERVAESIACFPQSLIGDAPLVTRLAIVEWHGDKMLESLLARAQASLDGQPVGATGQPTSGPMLDDIVLRHDMALVGVRPSGATPVRMKRRRQSDR